MLKATRDLNAQTGLWRHYPGETWTMPNRLRGITVLSLSPDPDQKCH